VRVIPSAHYFVADNWSLGGVLTVIYDDSNSPTLETKSVTFGAGVDLGYNVPLGELVSWWLRADLGYYTEHQRTLSNVVVGLGGFSPSSEGLNYSTDDHALALGLYLPFLLHPVKHFFLGLGPDAFVDLVHTSSSADNRRVHFGLGSTLGGWL